MEEKHDQINKIDVWEALPRSEVPKDAKMKKKSYRSFRVQVKVLMQISGEHHPAHINATIRTVSVRSNDFKWTIEIDDVQGNLVC